MKPAIDAVAQLLSREGNEDRSAEELATEIVLGIFEAIGRAFKQPAPPLEVGLVYSFPWSSQALSLVFQEGDARWFVGRSSEYGYLSLRSPDHVSLRHRKRSTGRFINEPPAPELIDPERPELGSRPAPEPAYMVGDWVQLNGAKAHRYKVVATAATTALLEGPPGTYTAFPFKELDKSFRFWRKKERTPCTNR